MSAEKAGLDLLRVEFAPHQVSKLPKQQKRDDQDKGRCEPGSRYSADGHFCGGWHARSIHLDYVGHAALTDRLLDADPEWSWEPVAFGPNGLPQLDAIGGLWIRLTVCGVTRLGYGDAQGKSGNNAIKEAIGDALRNAAMRFGAALDLWHRGDLHVEDETPQPQRPIEQVARETKLQRDIKEAAANLKIRSWDDVAADFATRNPGLTMRDADEDALLQFLADLKDEYARKGQASAGQLNPA